MEIVLKEILNELKTVKSHINNLEVDVREIKEEHGQKLNMLEADVRGIKEEHGQKLNMLEADVRVIKGKHGQKLQILETGVGGIKEEHGQMLRAILENKEIQKAEMDNLKMGVTKVTGVLKGFDDSLDLLKKAE